MDEDVVKDEEEGKDDGMDVGMDVGMDGGMEGGILEELRVCMLEGALDGRVCQPKFRIFFFEYFT